MSFDKIFDLTAGVYFYSSNVCIFYGSHVTRGEPSRLFFDRDNTFLFAQDPRPTCLHAIRQEESPHGMGVAVVGLANNVPVVRWTTAV